MNNNIESAIDPDLMTIASLVISSIATIGTTISTIIAVQEKNRNNIARPNIEPTLQNIEDSVHSVQSSLRRIVKIFEAQQQRTLSNDFNLVPRFGRLSPDFNLEEFQSYSHQIQKLEQAAHSMRNWARNMQTQALNNIIPNEKFLIEELSSLTDDSNKMMFDSKDFRIQIDLIMSSLERIERAIEGALRIQN